MTFCCYFVHRRARKTKILCCNHIMVSGSLEKFFSVKRYNIETGSLNFWLTEGLGGREEKTELLHKRNLILSKQQKQKNMSDNFSSSIFHPFVHIWTPSLKRMRFYLRTQDTQPWSLKWGLKCFQHLVCSSHRGTAQRHVAQHLSHLICASCIF